MRLCHVDDVSVEVLSDMISEAGKKAKQEDGRRRAITDISIRPWAMKARSGYADLTSH